jgi:NAD(P)-dependent dehydrogenase (short-subunit alcohol dehydrogenase family)
MERRLQGRTVVIGGAAGSQGRAGAILFAREGAHLALCDLDESGLVETARLVSAEVPDVELLSQRVDMRSMPHIEAFVHDTADRFGAIDVIYNNAGINCTKSIQDTTEGDFDMVHDINLKASFFMVKYALPALRRSDSASIINVSSGAGLLAPAEDNSLYCSSKGGLISLTRAQARDLAPDGIRVNCLLPGPIESAMVHGFFESMGPEKGAHVRDAVLARSLFKRFGQPAEVAAVAVFLATSEASYITASIIPVDAGWISV